MVFWVGILVGAVFGWSSAKKGFYETWAFVFNIIISIYLAVFLGPIIASIPGVGDMEYGLTLTLAATAIAAFLVLHGISYTFVTGQFSVAFPKVLNTVGAALLGFLAGFLLWSFVALLIYITPAISENTLVKKMDFSSQFEQTSAPYLAWWCNFVNKLSRQDSELTGEKAISGLLKGVEPDEQVKQAEPDKSVKSAEPNEVAPPVEKQPGPPPKAIPEDI